jgi:hypothetical protein
VATRELLYSDGSGAVFSAPRNLLPKDATYQWAVKAADFKDGVDDLHLHKIFQNWPTFVLHRFLTIEYLTVVFNISLNALYHHQTFLLKLLLATYLFCDRMFS